MEEKGIFSKVKVETIFEDSVSIRAISFKKHVLFYAGNNGKYGYINLENLAEKHAFQLPINAEFRSVASTEKADFILSAGSPAVLYEVNGLGKQHLNYSEEGEKVFYDSMKFWNDQEGIAVGDPTENCLSIIITRDSGKTWKKIPCVDLPKTVPGEAAFAASNSNIDIVGDNTWLISGGMKSRVYFSPDKGKTWEVFNTPLVQGKPTTGGYSIDFYNDKIGIIFGGDYTAPNENKANKAITFYSGETWELLAVGEFPGYKSCVQFVPGSNGREIVAVGPSGIAYSSNFGKTWSEISTEPFYTIRFVSGSVAYAAGKNRICKLQFEN
ncbi:MAG TPA: oxidoreductase [Flavobacteriaceae bacterium]|nr:oxidoreductase [Flavobacteriaceae bacterium]